MPSASTVVVGREVRLDVARGNAGCSAYLVAPGLDLHQAIRPDGTLSATFTPTEPGTYTYSCGLGMRPGTITVVDTA